MYEMLGIAGCVTVLRHRSLSGAECSNTTEILIARYTLLFTVFISAYNLLEIFLFHKSIKTCQSALNRGLPSCKNAENPEQLSGIF